MRRPSSVPEEWGTSDWFMGNQDTFKDWAASETFPRWLRVTFAAYAKVEANGHASFRQGELAVLLGDMLPSGLRVPTVRQRVREAIDNAVGRGLLDPGSKALCLIVPPTAVAFGKGRAEKCKRHRPRRMNAESVSSDHQTTRFQQVVSVEKNAETVSFPAQPSLSSPNTATPDNVAALPERNYR